MLNHVRRLTAHKHFAALAAILLFLIAGQAWAKRLPPKPVAPIDHQGVKYTAPNEDGCKGIVVAHDVKSGEKLWEVVIYKVKIDPNLEEDVQWVFITELDARDSQLHVTNEKGEQFMLNLKTKKVEKTK